MLRNAPPPASSRDPRLASPWRLDFTIPRDVLAKHYTLYKCPTHDSVKRLARFAGAAEHEQEIFGQLEISTAPLPINLPFWKFLMYP
jgi:hypothetical protein